MLLFKKQFLPAIRQGLKTQTIRLWKHRRMRAGQRSYIPGVGYITIESVDEVQLDELIDADALPDGFPSAEALRAELAALYPNELAAGYRAYRVRFRLLPPAQKPAKARKGTSPARSERSSAIARPVAHEKRRPADSAEDAVG